MKKDFDIDIVIPWVDGSDPVWNADKDKYIQGVIKNDGNGASRYRDWGLLKYWFRSIERNVSWINKIHFVTYGHVPAWLNTSYNKINIVKHNDFIPKDYLPTFNINPIELNLHRIKGLSDHFIYMNDDTFILKKIKRKFYFSSKGMPCQMLKIMCLDNYNPDTDFCYINFNDMGLLNRNFQVSDFPKSKLFSLKYGIRTNMRNLILPLSYIYPGFCQLHMPAPFLKKTFEDVWDKEENYLDNVCRHKFRHYKDVNQWLMQYWQFAEGKFTSFNALKYSKMFEIGIDNIEMYDALINQKYKVVCLNDSDSEIDFEKEKIRLQQVMNNLFPNKSKFEI